MLWHGSSKPGMETPRGAGIMRIIYPPMHIPHIHLGVLASLGTVRKLSRALEGRALRPFGGCGSCGGKLEGAQGMAAVWHATAMQWCGVERQERHVVH